MRMRPTVATAILLLFGLLCLGCPQNNPEGEPVSEGEAAAMEGETAQEGEAPPAQEGEAAPQEGEPALGEGEGMTEGEAAEEEGEGDSPNPNPNPNPNPSEEGETPATEGESAQEGEANTGPPVLALSTEELMIVLPASTGNFTVRNTGGGTLAWSIASLMPWAVCTPASGENTTEVAVSIDASQLPTTDFENQAVLTISTADGSVLLLVRVMPEGTPLPEGEDAPAEGEDAPEEPWLWSTVNEVNVPQDGEGTTRLYNNGGGALNWEISALPEWLNAEPMAGSGDAWVTFTTRDGYLNTGMNTGAVEVTSNGGDITLNVAAIGFDEDKDYAITAYWPLAEGNAWTWIRGGDFFTMEITAFQTHSSGLPVWTVDISDTIGYWSTLYLTLYEDTLCAANSLDVLDDPAGLLFGDVCWDGSCSFPMYTETLTPGWGRSPMNNHQGVPIVPGSLGGILSQWNIYNSSYTLDDFGEFGDPADCLAFVQNQQDIEEVYTLFTRGIGPVVWDAWRLSHARVGQQEWGAPPGQGIAAAGNSDGLLYFSRQASGATYYSGAEGQVRLVVHIDSGSGERYAVLFGEDYLVSSWMLDRLVTAMYRIPPEEDGVFDGNNAYHFLLQEGVESEAYFDILPGSLTETANTIAAAAEDGAQPLFDFIADSGVTEWDALVALADTPGPEQSRYALTALAFSAAQSAANMPLAEGKSITPLYFKMGLDVARALWNDAVLNEICPHCPTPGEPYYDVVICQGSSGVFAGSIEVCYYFFMPVHPVTDCTNVCKASIGCFTSICQPTQLNAENAALWPRIGGPIIQSAPARPRTQGLRGAGPSLPWR